MNSFIILVTGSRSYTDKDKVAQVLNRFNKSRYAMKVIVGDCPTGADKFVRDWCGENEVECQVFTADWDKHGRAAGPIRNKKMVAAKPDRVLAFFSGASRGTKDCVKQAIKDGINVIEFGKSRDN